jgi:glucose-6-phosphate dehydrogenase assembly protein OpcA
LSLLKHALPPDQAVPATIEALWSDLWTTLREQRPALTRIRTETLVAVTRGHAASALDTFDALAPAHPGRYIALVVDADGDPEDTVELCGQPDGAAGGEAVCVSATGPLAQHWGELVLPLLLPDLPVYLWLEDAALIAQPEFLTLLAAVDHVILDSGGQDPPWAVWAPLAAETAHLGQLDLSWIRLEPWRETMALAFDPPECLALLDGLQTIEGEGSLKGRADALWLWAWLGARLGYDGGAGEHLQRGSNQVRFLYREAAGEGLSRLSLGLGAQARLTLEHSPKGLHAQLVRGEAVLFEHLKPWDAQATGPLLERALREGHDPVFRQVLDWLKPRWEALND